MPSGISATITRGSVRGPFDEFRRFAVQRMEQAALLATQKAASIAKSRIRSEMAGAGLGKLGQAIDATSDKTKGRSVHRYSGGGFSASGVVFVRSKSERTLGAIEAYTQGADIRPVHSRWLWIPTDEIQRIAGSGAGRRRLTPGNWAQFGMDTKVGPLIKIKSINGYPLLVVKNTNVPLSGARGRPRANLKNGRAPKGYGQKQFLVAFIGIPFTARSARIDVTAIMRSVQAELPTLFNQAFGGR